MQGDLHTKALGLLRVLNEERALSFTSQRVIPHEVANRAGLDAKSDEYEETVALLLEEGFLVPYEDEVGAFRITRRGLDVLALQDEAGG